MSPETALKQAFTGNVKIDRKVLFLTEAQVTQIQKEAKAKLASPIITYYVSAIGDSITGYAFFETHIIRTKPETVMAIIQPDGSIRRITILAFHEPKDYLPTTKWLNLFEGKILSPGFWPKREIYNITGATLTVQALTLGVRKILATYKLIIAQETSS